MTWHSYDLDHIAQELVLKYRHEDVLNESHKMRLAVAYGLERFWGEHLRLRKETEGKYWKDTWDKLKDILEVAGIELPNEPVLLKDALKKEDKHEKKAREKANSDQINKMTQKLWDFAQDKPDDNRIALAVLTQLCDSLVWWTQRYKSK
jgi:hypothetical protein